MTVGAARTQVLPRPCCSGPRAPHRRSARRSSRSPWAPRASRSAQSCSRRLRSLRGGACGAGRRGVLLAGICVAVYQASSSPARPDRRRRRHGRSDRLGARLRRPVRPRLRRRAAARPLGRRDRTACAGVCLLVLGGAARLAARSRPRGSASRSSRAPATRATPSRAPRHAQRRRSSRGDHGHSLRGGRPAAATRVALVPAGGAARSGGVALRLIGAIPTAPRHPVARGLEQIGAGETATHLARTRCRAEKSDLLTRW